MKRIGVGLGLLLSLAAGVSAQEDQTAELESKYADKLKKEFATKVTWSDSLEKARATSKESGKLILGYFTRSYAP